MANEIFAFVKEIVILLHSFSQLLLLVHLLAQFLLQTENEIVFISNLQLQMLNCLLLSFENCLEVNEILYRFDKYMKKKSSYTTLLHGFRVRRRLVQAEELPNQFALSQLLLGHH